MRFSLRGPESRVLLAALCGDALLYDGRRPKTDVLVVSLLADVLAWATSGLSFGDQCKDLLAPAQPLLCNVLGSLVERLAIFQRVASLGVDDSKV